MIWEDLGAVSAYAIALEKGYLGTKEDFAQMLINAAKNCTVSAESHGGIQESDKRSTNINRNY